MLNVNTLPRDRKEKRFETSKVHVGWSGDRKEQEEEKKANSQQIE
jgi:hypothetical protein